MSNNAFEGSIGVKITRINDSLGEIKKLSDLGENWNFDAECTNCGRILNFDKNKVNKMTTCPCGQKIYIQILSELL